MPENRGQQHHRERVADALREEIATIVQGELADPRIGPVTVVGFQLSPDGKDAHVFFQAEGSEEEAARTYEGLVAAKGFIRREAAERLGLHHMPELHFSMDPTGKNAARVEELLRRIKKRTR